MSPVPTGRRQARFAAASLLAAVLAVPAVGSPGTVLSSWYCVPRQAIPGRTK